MHTRQLVLGCVIALATMISGCRGDPRTVMTRLEQSQRLTAELRLKFSQATDASNRAVMADTQEAAVATAGEAQQAAQAVEKDKTVLGALLRSLNYAPETALLEAFGGSFAEYRRIDRQILELAAENTNLKARALSFGPASEAADAFETAVSSLAAAVAAKDRCRANGVAAEAILAVRKIQVWYSPHIAERDEARMHQLELLMARSYAQAGDALSSLELMSVPADPLLSNARTALSRFKAISDQIVALSQRNSNVLSLDLSLRQKPTLTTACNERLAALQAELAKEEPKSSR